MTTSFTLATALVLLAVPAPRGSHEIQIAAWGPSAATIDAARSRVERHHAVRARLRGTRHRLLLFQLLDDGKDEPPSRFEAVFFDYSHNRAFSVTGALTASASIDIAPLEQQPMPNDEELAEAIRILRRSGSFGADLRAGRLTAYAPMPPLLNETAPVSAVERTVLVGLAPPAADGSAKAGTPGHEIVGVNLIRRVVVRLPGGAPVSSLATAAACGAANAAQSTTPRGTSGSFNVIIRRDGAELWNFIVVRPAASSGTRGSGLELRTVRYRGKKVLARAHAPILNVEYDRNLCGPYRDWQWQENAFVADGTTVAPGVRRTVTKPSTIIDSGVDQGNFRGVAFFDDGASVHMATELQAAWYRYVMKWTLRDDGTLQPRFGFGGVQNSCVCNLHRHHAYWRLNFDVVQAAGNAVCVSAAAGQPCVDLQTESRLASAGAYLEVRNLLGTEAVRLTPGPHDGVPDTYSKASAWILQFVSGQTDDGVNCTQGSSCPTSIQIDKFLSGQAVRNADVVVWYRTSFVHAEGAAGTTDTQDHEGGHIVGPELRVSGW